MNNSVMKCCICNNEKSGEFITINDKKYHLCCIEQLQKQYIDLKEHYNNMFECHCNRVQVEKLQNNWNELKKDLKQDYDYLNQFVMSGYFEFDSEEQMVSAYQDIAKRDLLKNKLDKMQELEQGKDE